MEWRFLKDVERPGAFHMAVDSALLDSVGRGDSPPTLRAYTWRPHAVSLGRGQRRSLRLDPDKCRRAGVDVVIRPSGGRAVLHSGDVTYAAIFPAEGLIGAAGVRGTYRRLAGVLMATLSRLGIEAGLASTRELGGPAAALPCFTSAARDEMLVEGRKLVGSAQRRTRTAVLQHGAMLVRGDQTELASLVVGEEQAKALREDLAGRTVTMEELLGRSLTFDAVAEALRSAAEEVLDVGVVDGKLAEEELRDVERLMLETPGWRDETDEVGKRCQNQRSYGGAV